MANHSQGLGAHRSLQDAGLHRVICFCGSSAGCIPFFLRLHISPEAEALAGCVETPGSECVQLRSAKGSARMLLVTAHCYFSLPFFMNHCAWNLSGKGFSG